MLSKDFLYFPGSLNNFNFQELVHSIEWQQSTIKIYGKTHPIPRLEAWFGEKSYTYSKKILHPHPFNTYYLNLLNITNDFIYQHLGLENYCNSCLVNFYRDGQDAMGWHRDNEKELGDRPLIASVSFGACRVFKIRPYKKKDATQVLNLFHGDLLIMLPGMQEKYEHCLPRSLKVTEPRYNFTFRRLV